MTRHLLLATMLGTVCGCGHNWVDLTDTQSVTRNGMIGRNIELTKDVALVEDRWPEPNVVGLRENASEPAKGVRVIDELPAGTRLMIAKVASVDGYWKKAEGIVDLYTHQEFVYTFATITTGRQRGRMIVVDWIGVDANAGTLNPTFARYCDK
jgi:hypothetical protein